MTNFFLHRRALMGLALTSALPATSVWAAGQPLPVVASFSILQDLTRQVGGDLVTVSALVGPDGDAHVFEPTPQQARQLLQAKVLVANGLGFEGWLPRLKKASGFKGQEIVASQGIAVRILPNSQGHSHGAGADKAGHDHGHGHHHGHNHGPQDPHAWQDVRNAIVYVRNIAQGLAKADPANAAQYDQQARQYIARLTALDASLRQRFAALPAERRSVVSTHDAFGYFAQAYGLRFVPVRGLSTESEPSARDMAALVKQVREERIGAIFVENISDPRLLEQLARETGAAMGGRLYSDALSPAGGPASTYIDMVETNAATLLKALQAD
ncbi:zinc/manganese transport system substrate-binding protein [Comamonas sp. BIGb0152]|uniref:metal ABC transporter substrate-binding protein n=1 Tax=Comamonas sp. BIGb0152 TaxID=2940601 RepID=UPI002167D672|nr:metal ABC transporter substrate-binding protein [Comamonas sp. BIGb0152]MCS4294623.1 zinc/manganese transport system substrate-binding protein [Comamonas sp. BIGb0152]